MGSVLGVFGVLPSKNRALRSARSASGVSAGSVDPCKIEDFRLPARATLLNSSPLSRQGQ